MPKILGSVKQISDVIYLCNRKFGEINLFKIEDACLSEWPREERAGLIKIYQRQLMQ